MRNIYKGLGVVALLLFSELTAAANTPSINGTSIPYASQIVDSQLNVWTLSGNDQVFENGKLITPSNIGFLLFYGGIVYEMDNSSHWSQWNPSTHTFVASADPLRASISGTTLPGSRQIVDTQNNVWELSGGQAYKNGLATPSGGVILLLCYGGVVYQENAQHHWWLWDANFEVMQWVASADPRVPSASGAVTVPATQIVDSAHNVWTDNSGVAFLNGVATHSSGVVQLIYLKGVVYQENGHNNFYAWRNGTWAATPAPVLPSANGTAIPTATEIVDTESNLWTVSNGQVFENHALTPSSGVILLLFSNGSVYQENAHHNWWRWNGTSWISTPNPRTALAYVGSVTLESDHLAHNTVTVVDTSVNAASRTIPMAFEAKYMAVSPDSKHVYATGAWNTNFGSVAVIDTSTETVVTSSIEVPYPPAGILASPDGKKVYVLTEKAVAVIDTSSNAVVASIPLPGAIQAPNPRNGRNLAISPDGKELYVPDGSVVDVFDTATNALVNSFTIQTGPNVNKGFLFASVSPATANLYTNFSSYPTPNLVGGDYIAAFNPTNGAVTAKLPDVLDVGVFSSDSRHLYGLGLGGIAVIDTATSAATSGVPNLYKPTDFAITPDGAHFYITEPSTGGMLVADTATYTISSVVYGNFSPTGPIVMVRSP